MVVKKLHTVSIIVPVFNSEKYIDKCLSSILAQTYPYYEVWIIDDGSTDKSGEICDRYSTMDRRINVIHQENSGVSAARNAGLQVSTGKYFLFIDSDDYIESNTLDILVSHAEKSDCDLVIFQYYIEDKNHSRTIELKYNSSYCSAESITHDLIGRYYANTHAGLFSLCNKLIKSSIISDNNLFFDTSLKRGEDAWFIFQFLKCCNKVDFIPQTFYHYTQHANSVMHTHYDDQYEKWVEMRKRLLKENKTLSFSIDYNLFYSDFLYKVAIYCRDEIQRKNIKKVISIFKDPFYLSASKYCKNLPNHIKLIHRSAHANCYLAIMEIKLWLWFSACITRLNRSHQHGEKDLT